MSTSLRIDVAIAAAVALVAVGGTAVIGMAETVGRSVDAIALVLAGCSAAGVSVRRYWPEPVLLVVVGLISGYLLAGYPYGPIFLPLVVAVYTLARYRPIGTAWPWATVAFLGLAPHVFVHPLALSGLAGLIPAAAWIVVPLSLGATVRLTVQAREREQADALRRGIDDERLRIAQEVHDVVGHGLAAIKMQADVALHVLAKRPEQAEQALAAISRTSTEALEEVRTTLAAVRGGQADDRSSSAPGMGDVDELVRRMTDAGVAVDVTTSGTPQDLPPPADLAAYRLLQESLTNVLKHDERKVADVAIRYDDAAVRITVSNPAPSPRSGDDGLGIAGMTERVTALGGTVAAGPTADGRFEVDATIPTDAAP